MDALILLTSTTFWYIPTCIHTWITALTRKKLQKILQLGYSFQSQMKECRKTSVASQYFTHVSWCVSTWLAWILQILQKQVEKMIKKMCSLDVSRSTTIQPLWCIRMFVYWLNGIKQTAFKHSRLALIVSQYNNTAWLSRSLSSLLSLSWC